MMSNFNEIDQGDGYKVSFPISSKEDFYLKFIYLNAPRRKSSTYNKNLVFELLLTYEHDHVYIRLIENILDLEEFRSTLQCFIERKIQLGEKSRFFELKEHNKIKSLKFTSDEIDEKEDKRYISIEEAMRMYRILTYFLSNYDLSYQYDQYTFEHFEYVSQKWTEKNRSYNDKTKILDFHDLTDPYYIRPKSLL